MRLRHALLSLLLAAAAHAQDFPLKIIAFNDFHGNLQSPGTFRATHESPAVPVGGIDYFAAYVAHLKAENPVNVVVSSGDLTGASPLISTLFHDEDTIEAMNRLGLDINGVGNHEFDKGREELLRRQVGGCSKLDANTCEGKTVGTPYPFEGAKFKYLAANVDVTATGKTVFPAWEIKQYRGVKVAFIGLTLKDTPTIVVPAGVAGLRFDDEAATINAAVQTLQKQGVHSFVVLLHVGGFQTRGHSDDINACAGDLAGSEVREVVSKLDNAVDLVLSAHTHAAYVCQLPNSTGRKISVSSASAFGRMLTDVDVTLNPKSGRITSVSAHNILVDRTNPDIKPDAAIKAIVDHYDSLSAPIVNRVVGSISADIKKSADDSGESPLGDLIADAQLAATSGPDTGRAIIAFMNAGGIRADLPFASRVAGVANGQVTFGALFTSQPFGNDLVTMTLTGAQLKTMLEEQFKGCGLGAPARETAPTGDRMLMASEGFAYTWSKSAEPCHKVDAASIKLNGTAVSPTASYRITVNSLLADGGAQFFVLKQGTDRLIGPADIEAMTAWFSKHPAVAPVTAHRITVAP